MAGGRLSGGGVFHVNGFAIDSRVVGPREVFVALAGTRSDGHRFVAEVARRGAAAAVVMQPVAAPAGFPLVVVEDTALALQQLGRAFRSRWPLRVVGITGSAGKTTTKEFTAALLATRFRVFRSEGNLNNLYGLPLTLTRRRPDDEIAVLELGMSTPGELRQVAAIARPDVAVITNVGQAHRQNFASVDAIAEAKAEILEGLSPGGSFVANADDVRVAAIAARCKGPVVSFGFSEAAEVRASAVEAQGATMGFTLHAGGRSAPAVLGGVGRHHVLNALAALAVARALGIDPLELVAELAGLAPGKGRGRLLRLANDVLVLDDAYNANPEALLAAAYALPEATRKVAIVGDMLELGDSADSAHDDLGRALARLGYGLVVGVGPLGRRVAQAARDAGVAETLELSDALAAAQAAPDLVRAGDAVLVKASHGVGLHVVVEALERTGSR